MRGRPAVAGTGVAYASSTSAVVQLGHARWTIENAGFNELVTPDGLALSIGSEFVENTDPPASKQDCELKAFQRLAQRLDQDFPQLRICLCLDGLDATGPRWRFVGSTAGSTSSASRQAACRRSGRSMRPCGTSARRTA